MSQASNYAAEASRILTGKAAAIAEGKRTSGAILGQTIATLGQVIPQQVQEVMQRNAQKRKAEQIQAIFQKHQGDLGAAIPEIMTIDPEGGSKLAESLGKAQKLKLEMDTLEQTAKKTREDRAYQDLAGATNQDQWEQALLNAHTLGVQHPFTDPTWTPALRDRVQLSRLSPEKQYEAAHPKPNLMSLGGGAVMDANTQTMVREASLTPDQVADNARAAEAEKRAAAAQAETVRHNQALERIGLLGAGRAEASAAEAARHNRAMEENARNTKVARPLTSGDAGRIADIDTSLNDLVTLRSALTETKGSTGTGAAIGAGMPAWVTDLTGWGTDPKKRQGVIDRVKQVIGKTLEGGVLRKEDEIKYEKILPNIKDTAEVATSKLNGLETAISQRRSTFLDDLDSAGFDTSKFPAEHKTVAPPPPPGGTPQVGSTVTFSGKRYKVKAIKNGQAELEPIP